MLLDEERFGMVTGVVVGDTEEGGCAGKRK